ncbi:Afadin and alpha-actinin-binding-domain-containing protein [Collybia nuda]|uniref:Afadin and alpha-actinin-binding-domain-containing protein n=1 Tax=Collybia nuda TaxID=64659 RepID=A0A9P6CMP8_9AGAR|nr:Afadin and alpha-actinin-binding-domain-containing protein [Collybia nuda]
MEVTPQKLVHWDIDGASLSDLGSPFFNGSIESVVSTSSMEYINSQLVAHGFISSPGLGLEGISSSDLDRAAKCLLGMLGQRIEDMGRTEELTTKLRTLSYDNERLRSMHQNATERAANAEREMNVHKSRLASATRTLQTTESAHKHTMTELQRTRTVLLGVKATHQSELKKKEKDIERMAEKWTKVADAQAKLMSIPSGMRCANVMVVDGSEMYGKGQGYLEVALEEAEKSRKHLTEENFTLRKLVLTAFNEIQAMPHQAAGQPIENEVMPTPFTLSTLFPLHPEGNANDKLNLMLVELRTYLAAISQPISAVTAKTEILPSNEEVEHLQRIIATLKDEIETSQKQLVAQAAETQSVLDKFLEDHRNLTNDVGEMSIELMRAPLCDEEKERIDKIKKELDVERQKFTDAAIKLGKERAELEAERLKLLDEKRSWQVEMMLAELPPTPQPAVPTPRITATRPSPKKPHQSPRKSPAKVCVGKAGNSIRKATRVSRRSVASTVKVIPAYETEVLPPLPAPTFHVDHASLGSSLLPTSFVLPPPSPHASLPTEPALPPAVPPNEVSQSHPSIAAATSPPLPSSGPSTPPTSRRLFPVAKPFAQRMIHAYSPAKPSPLSRILLLGNSPNSPDGAGTSGDSDVSSLLQPVTEEDEIDLGFGQIPTYSQEPQVFLAAELGIASAPESPLQEKKLEPNVTTRKITTAVEVKTAKGRVMYTDSNRFTAKEKGKGKATTETANAQTRIKTSAAVEKENTAKSSKGSTTKSRVSPPGLEITEMKKVAKPPSKPSAGVTGSRARLLAKLPPPSKTGGGPRRVLVDSVEAPIIGKGWKG